MLERREHVKRNASASGISEEYGEKEVLLDDLILEIDEKHEAENALREEKNANEKRLLLAGEKIRDQALRRRSNPVHSVLTGVGAARSAEAFTSGSRSRTNEQSRPNDEGAVVVVEDTPAALGSSNNSPSEAATASGSDAPPISPQSRRPKTKKRTPIYDSDDEVQDMLIADMEGRRKLEDERMELEKKRIQMEQ